MSWIKTILFVLFICCFPLAISAQFISVDDTKNATALVQKLTSNASCISISGETAKGDPLNLIQNSYGIFNKNNSSFPFSSGIVLSTWESKNSEGPYTNLGGGIDWAGDSDINTVLGISSSNASSLEFDFTAETSFLSFNYIFASNEYIKDNPCKYSDGLVLLIKDLTTSGSYTNLAVLPDGTSVSSNNIHPAINYSDTFTNTKCDAKNESYFGLLNSVNPSLSPINYAGQTAKLTAKTVLTIGHSYHIKLAIANDRDNDNNSAVFVEAGSFTSKIDLGVDRLLATHNAICSGQNYMIDTKLNPATYSFQWYKDDSSTAIPSETNATLNVTQAGKYKVEASLIGAACSFTGEITIEMAPSINLQNVSLSKCDDNGTGVALFDLTKTEAIVTNNDPNNKIVNYFLDSGLNSIIPDPKNYQKTTSGEELIYVQVTNTNVGCTGIATITLKTLSSSYNPISIVAPMIMDLSGGKNTIELLPPTNATTYEYSIDGHIFQPQPKFIGIAKGDYIAYIRNTSNCEYVTYPFTILDYPTFFTPNGDGTHDIWKIENLSVLYPNAKTYIFDRYGKLLKQFDTNSTGWDGTFLGINLPADDYWFRLITSEEKTINGHFSLKR